MYSDFYDKHLRTFSAEPSSDEIREIPYFGSFPEIFRVFQQITGWKMELVRSQATTLVQEFESGDRLNPSESSRKETFSDSIFAEESKCLANIPVVWDDESRRATVRLVLKATQSRPSFVDSRQALSLARSIASVFSELYRTTFALRRAEAEAAVRETASQVANLNRRFVQDQSLSDRLTQQLKKGSIAIDCQASSLYRLDNGTTSLKIRACWGLPDERLAEPARPLRGALADLEALLGNAVILNESYLFELWKAPECFSTSICVPIQSSDAILGTIWFFSDRKTDFSMKDLQILEIVSGRVALELEYASLLNQKRD